MSAAPTNWRKCAIKLVGAGIGTAVAGPLGTALGGSLGGLFSEEAEKFIQGIRRCWRREACGVQVRCPAIKTGPNWRWTNSFGTRWSGWMGRRGRSKPRMWAGTCRLQPYAASGRCPTRCFSCPCRPRESNCACIPPFNSTVGFPVPLQQRPAADTMQRVLPSYPAKSTAGLPFFAPGGRRLRPGGRRRSVRVATEGKVEKIR